MHCKLSHECLAAAGAWLSAPTLRFKWQSARAGGPCAGHDGSVRLHRALPVWRRTDQSRIWTNLAGAHPSCPAVLSIIYSIYRWRRAKTHPRGTLSARLIGQCRLSTVWASTEKPFSPLASLCALNASLNPISSTHGVSSLLPQCLFLSSSATRCLWPRSAHSVHKAHCRSLRRTP